MIRANLLPPKRPGVGVFGLQVTPQGIFRFFVTSGIAAIAILLINFSMSQKIASRQADLDSLNTQISMLTAQTNQINQLSSDVHRLQEIDRDAQYLHQTGQVVALRLAYLGNAIPRGAWVEHVAQGSQGWTFDGGASDLSTVGNVVRGIAKISPGMQTLFQSVDHHSGYGFKMTISNPSPTPAPPPPASTTSTPAPGMTPVPSAAHSNGAAQ